jgi:LmbE family N-acetylglucosaminyl deacetylase
MSETPVTRRGLLRGVSGLAAGTLLGSILGENASAADSADKPPEKKTILVIGAHMDDCEIGAGGVIAKAVKRGHRVVLVNVASDYSTWRVTQGREKQIRERLIAKAREMGVEKRFLDYGYQQVADDLPTMRRLSEVVVDVKPDITFLHSRHELDRSPSDHSTLGTVSEKAVRNADTILGGLSTVYGKEMYAYEVYPQSSFVPGVFVDIRDVLLPLLETINFFGALYGESPHWPQAGRIDAALRIPPDGPELPLTHYAEMKYAVAVFRGAQSGVRFAEAFRGLDPTTLGRRLLERIL